MSVEWQTEATEPVLHVLYQANIGVSPGAIVANIETFGTSSYSEEEVEDALEELEDGEMVRELERGGYYVLTEHGRDYVDHEFEETGLGYID